MSYARVGADSDVYVIFDVGGYYHCMGCSRRMAKCHTAAMMLDHLKGHMEAGEKVPVHTLERLEKDKAEGR